MARSIIPAIRAELEASHGGQDPRVFIALSHASLAQTIYVVNATATFGGVPVTYLYNPNNLLVSPVWQAYPFSIELLTDSDEAPRGRLEIANINRIPGNAVQDAVGSTIDMVAYVVPAEAFDLTVNPRVPLILPVTPILRALGLHLSNIQVDALSVSGDVSSLDDTQEPYPSTRAIANILPGLFIG